MPHIPESLESESLSESLLVLLSLLSSGCAVRPRTTFGSSPAAPLLAVAAAWCDVEWEALASEAARAELSSSISTSSSSCGFLLGGGGNAAGCCARGADDGVPGFLRGVAAAAAGFFRRLADAAGFLSTLLT